MDREPVEIRRVVERARAPFRELYPERVYAMELPHAGVFITGHALRLEALFRHLLDNAIKYSFTDFTVRMAVTPLDGAVRIAVSDDGIGIPAGDLRRVQDAFRRSSNVRGHDAG